MSAHNDLIVDMHNRLGTGANPTTRRTRRRDQITDRRLDLDALRRAVPYAIRALTDDLRNRTEEQPCERSTD